jgi:hypothetical protein
MCRILYLIYQCYKADREAIQMSVDCSSLNKLPSFLIHLSKQSGRMSTPTKMEGEVLECGGRRLGGRRQLWNNRSQLQTKLILPQLPSNLHNPSAA